MGYRERREETHVISGMITGTEMHLTRSKDGVHTLELDSTKKSYKNVMNHCSRLLVKLGVSLPALI